MALGTWVVVLCVAASPLAAADAIADSARALAERHAEAVVAVQLVLKEQMTMFGRNSQEQENKGEITGTMIDPSGLTVASLTSLDPTSIVTDAMTAGMGMGMDLKMESQVASARILLPDGKELEAQVVLRDPDLDLVFIRPKEKPATPLAYVDLSDTYAPVLMDEVITVSRLGNLGHRSPSVSACRIEAVVEKPRLFYVPEQELSAALTLGCPVFSAVEGKTVGVRLVRKGKTDALSARDFVMAIILPASDILEASKQAPAFGEVLEPAPEAPAPEAPAEATP